MAEADIAAIRAAGGSDEEILEVNQVCAYFNYANRLLNGLGVTLAGDTVGYYAETKGGETVRGASAGARNEEDP